MVLVVFLTLVLVRPVQAEQMVLRARHMMRVPTVGMLPQVLDGRVIRQLLLNFQELPTTHFRHLMAELVAHPLAPMEIMKVALVEEVVAEAMQIAWHRLVQVAEVIQVAEMAQTIQHLIAAQVVAVVLTTQAQTRQRLSPRLLRMGM
jgi:hypothetical protein